MIGVEQITLTHIAMPLVTPFETSFGRDTVREAVVVEVRTAAGSGWGQTVAFEAVAVLFLRDGRDLLEHSYALPRAGRAAPAAEHAGGIAHALGLDRGHHMARAAIEGAVAALLAEAAGQSLAAYLGGTRDRVPVGVSVGIQESPEALREVVGGFLAAGYGRIKLKIKPGADVGYVARCARPSPTCC